MNRLIKLHTDKAVQWAHEDRQDKGEDEYHAELTLDIMTKLSLWMAWLSQQEDPDVSFDSLEGYIKHFIENVYKSEV